MTARALVLAAVLPLGVALAAETPTPAPQPPQKAEEKYMNVLALKGIPADELMPAMQFMSASLGVDCEYCHVDGKPESDENKKKLAAREMIELQRSINANFNGHTVVTCMTCHRGSTHPVAVPAVGGLRRLEAAPRVVAARDPEACAAWEAALEGDLPDALLGAGPAFRSLPAF